MELRAEDDADDEAEGGGKEEGDNAEFVQDVEGEFVDEEEVALVEAED